MFHIITERPADIFDSGLRIDLLFRLFRRLRDHSEIFALTVIGGIDHADFRKNTCLLRRNILCLFLNRWIAPVHIGMILVRNDCRINIKNIDFPRRRIRIRQDDPVEWLGIVYGDADIAQFLRRGGGACTTAEKQYGQAEQRRGEKPEKTMFPCGESHLTFSMLLPSPRRSFCIRPPSDACRRG